jgi:hypothetical protein
MNAETNQFMGFAALLAFIAAWLVAVKSPGLRDWPWPLRHLMGLFCGFVALFDVGLVFQDGGLDIWVILGSLTLALLFVQFSPLVPPFKAGHVENFNYPPRNTKESLPSEKVAAQTETVKREIAALNRIGTIQVPSVTPTTLDQEAVKLVSPKPDPSRKPASNKTSQRKRSTADSKPKMETPMAQIDDDGQPRASFNYAANIKKAMNTLLGICSGLIADGALSDGEIIFLDTWLKDNESILGQWPASSIAERVGGILADGVITEQERSDLFDALSQLDGCSQQETGVVSGMATRLGMNEVYAMAFPGMEFCLTGKFIYGTRAKCEAAIMQRGGIMAHDVSRHVDYLIVGALASKDWVHTSHGRKIQKAMDLIATGHHMTVIAEENWVRFL